MIPQTDAEYIEQMESALNQIADWADAYPLENFPDQDLTKANVTLACAGISMSAMSGQWARHLLKGVGSIARNGLKRE